MPRFKLRARLRLPPLAAACAVLGDIETATSTSLFPLEISANRRHLQDAQGNPRLIIGDSAWSLAVQLTTAEAITYLDDRQARGFNAILFNAIEHSNSSQTPKYRNVNGDDPFTTPGDFGSLNTPYWDHVKSIFDAAKARGFLCVIAPAYFGFQAGSQGWSSEIDAEDDPDLFSYGVELGTMFPDAAWFFGGDDDGTPTRRAKQRQILAGIQSVRTTDLTTFHPSPNKRGLETVALADYNPNYFDWLYPYIKDAEYPYVQAAEAYAVSGPAVPFMLMESDYINEHATTRAMIRQQMYTALLSGACGAFFGDGNIWPFLTGWESALGGAATQDVEHVISLFNAFAWEKLQPETGSNLVTSGKGSGTSIVSPALANDGSFALIYVPDSQDVTIDMSAFASSSVRVRRYSVTAGTYSDVSGTPFPNTGTQVVSSGGECILVCDADPSSSHWQGDTINAASTSFADVQTAYNAASDGDIIAIPAGSSSWASSLPVTKAVHIKGAGGGRVEGSSTSSLVIEPGSKTFTLEWDSTTGKTSWINDFTVGETVRARCKYNAANWMEGTVTSWNSGTRQLVLDISTTGGSGTLACWVFEMPAATTITHNAGSDLFALTESSVGHVGLSDLRIIRGTGSGPMVSFAGGIDEPCLVWNMRFSNSGSAGRVSDVLSNQGVVFKCYLDAGFDWDNAANNLVPGYGFGFKNTSNGGVWTQANRWGTNDTDGKGNFYVESCFITGYSTEAGDFDDGSRGCFRNCIFDNSAHTSHGQDTSSVGTRHWQVYDNYYIFNDVGTATMNLNYWFFIRGGSGVITDNVMPDITSSEWGNKSEIVMTVQQLRRNAGPNACWNSGWPAPRQPGQGHNGSTTVTEGIYVWNNQGSPPVGLADYDPDECGGGPSIGTYLQLNRDFFTRAPQAGDEIESFTKYAFPHPLRAGAT